MRNPLRSVRDSAVGARKGVGAFCEVAGPILKPFYPVFSVVLALLTLQVAIQAVYPLLYGKLTDALVQRDVHLSVLMFALLVLQGFLHLRIAYRRERYEIDHLDWTMNLRIMTESLERISGFSMAQSSQMHSGKARDIVRKGRIAVRHLVYLALYRFGPVAMYLVVAVTCLMLMHRLLGAVAILSVSTYLVFRLFIFQQHRQPIKQLDDLDNENGKLFADTLSNMEVVQAYARQQRTVGDFTADSRQLVDGAQNFWRTAIIWYYGANGIAFVSKYAIMGLTAWMFFGDAFTFGAYVAITQWAMMAMNAMQELGQMQREISGEWAYAETYLDLLRKKPEILPNPDGIKPERLRGHIVFDDVTFSYDPRASDDPLKGGEPVVALDSVSFEIPAGQKVALVGESGAGKSTIAYALMRARDPKTGAIFVDGTDMRQFDQDALRRRIGYVPQHPRLFDRTLRYNLTFGLEDGSATDEQLRELLETVKLTHLADGDGLDRRLGEGGHTLSGGERQRLCIARALIKNPDILIFDEATSSLDPVNEKKVQDAIDAVTGRTRIIIAHRYSTIRGVDRILVFDSGRLIADGTHETLLTDSPYFRELLVQQGLL